MTPKTHWTDALVKLGACDEAVIWAKRQPNYETAWAKCQRADWMLWLAERLAKRNSAEHKRVVRAACACARTALKHVPRSEKLPLKAIQAAERWSRGAATIAEVRAAAAYASAAAYAYASAYAYSAAYSAASAAAYEAAVAAYAARGDSLKSQADMLRRRFYKSGPDLGVSRHG
jgi:hypothetical protein